MAFVRRKARGSTFYYELVENVRENGKVVQKVIQYFPTLEAANLYCEKKGIRKIEKEKTVPPSLESRLEEKLKKLNSLRPLPKTALAKLKEKFEVDMTYNSNAIEGNRLTLRETWLVLRKGITIGGKSIQEHLEAKNHLEAIHLLFQLADAKRKITEQDILDLHRLVMSKIDDSIAGKYRAQQVYIEGAAHVPPPPNKVRELIGQVIGEMNKPGKGMETVKSASRIHHLIAWIHPFVDGNGRVARLLLNLKLMRGGFPPVVLLKTERRSYYSALEKADDGDLYPITTMIANSVGRSLDIWLGAAA
ncbi:MAG: Fic family protein [Candidatus Micrarchaeota archaeon]